MKDLIHDIDNIIEISEWLNMHVVQPDPESSYKSKILTEKLYQIRDKIKKVGKIKWKI